MNKSSFSEQCYYTFGDIASALQSCNIKVGQSCLIVSQFLHLCPPQDNSDGSETDRDTLGPLPGPMATPGTHPVAGVQPWPTFPNTYSNPPNLGPIYNPAPPPSTYMTFGGPGMGVAPGPGLLNQSPSGSGGSGGGSSLRHTLAASGSGSESDAGGGIANLSISSYPKNLQGVTS